MLYIQYAKKYTELSTDPETELVATKSSISYTNITFFLNLMLNAD